MFLYKAVGPNVRLKVWSGPQISRTELQVAPELYHAVVNLSKISALVSLGFKSSDLQLAFKIIFYTINSVR